MDQRGYPVDPSETESPSTFPAVRLLAWCALAASAHVIALVPAQNAPAAA